jgi:polyphenol oxidase
MLRAALLADLPHGFSTREEPALGALLPGASLVLARQVHSPQVVTVAAPWRGDPPEADALVTATPGLLLGIVTADCAPVLLADRAAGIVGAAHAGWRGAVAGVIGNTLAAMIALGARREDIVAAIGPTIAQASYEVDDALRCCFPGDAEQYFAAGRSGHWQFDLPGYVADRLRAAGIAAIEDLAMDTYSQPDQFYSFRRATHRGEPTGGRQISVIGLPQ